MSPPLQDPPSFSAARRFGIGLNVAVSVMALVALVCMLNYLAARHFYRFHWTSDARYTLSPQTRSVLASLTNEVRITLLYDRDHPLFGAVSGLLKEYAYACPKVSLEHVDYKRDLARAQLIMAKYQLPQAETDLVVFEAGGRIRAVRSTELSEYDWTRLLAGEKEVRRVAFKGEGLFTAALAGVVDARPPVAYYLEGHGEHDPGSDEPKFGYAKFATLLRQKNIDLRPLRLVADSPVPADCQLLIVAGPQSRFEPAELDQLGKYLNQGGRLLALLSHYRSRQAATGLERLLANWGVTVGGDYAFDLKDTTRGHDLVTTNLASHPIVKPLHAAGLPLYLVLARSVAPAASAMAGADVPRAQALVWTSAEGFTAGEIAANGVPRFNPLKDRRGTIPVAVAVEKGSIQGVSADRGSTRLVVVGESVFLANETIVKAGNMDFANLAVNWLLDRPQFMGGIAARPIQEYHVTLTHAELVRIRWLLLGALPGTVLAFGLLVWVRRRA